MEAMQAMKLIKHKCMLRVNHTEQQNMRTAHGDNLADLQDGGETVVTRAHTSGWGGKSKDQGKRTKRQLHGSISRSPTTHLASWKLEPQGYLN